jgi:hypothetical protein
MIEFIDKTDSSFANNYKIPQRYFDIKDRFVILDGLKEFVYRDGKKVEIERTGKRAFPVYGYFDVERKGLIAVDDKMEENNHGKIGKHFHLTQFITDAHPELKTLNDAVKEPITISNTTYYSRDEFDQDVSDKAESEGKVIRQVWPVMIEHRYYDAEKAGCAEVLKTIRRKKFEEDTHDTSKESEKKYFTQTISVPNPGKIDDLCIKPMVNPQRQK